MGSISSADLSRRPRFWGSKVPGDRMRRVNEALREVQAGFECGITLENFMDVKEGDVIEVYEKAQVERTLE